MTDSAHDDDRRTPGGDPVVRHREDDFAPDDTVAPRDEARRLACQAHLTRFLGDEFTLLTEKVSMGIHLDVYVFGPSEAFPHVTLVTSGMSDVAMTMPPGAEGDRMELMLGVPAGWPGIDPLDSELLGPENFWPFKLLKDVARIPSTYNSFVTWGHTIADDEGDLYAPGLPYTGALVAPPLGYPAQIMRATTPAGEVDHLAVLPLTREEMDFKVATPGGGDALIDRLQERGVTAVVRPDRPGVVAGPPPWSVHVLTPKPMRHLGDALATVMPNRAALLAEDGSSEEVLPAGDDDFVRWRVSGPIQPLQLARDAEASPQGELVAAALRDHQGVITLTPERDGSGGQVVAVMAMLSILAEGDLVAAIWFPQQQHVTTGEQLTKEIADGVPLHFRVRPLEVTDGSPAVITHGFAALGGQEVLYREDGLDTARLTRWTTKMLARHYEMDDELPGLGTQLKFGWTKYELLQAEHPTTGAPVLEIVEAPKKKRGLFGRKG